MKPMERMSAAYAEIEESYKVKRQAKDAARRAEEATEVKALLRKRFLALPGTTEDEFENQYPTLLAEHRQRLMDQR